jgi:hypothetical protein
MACPICVSPEGTAITEGIRAGAGILIIATVIVIGVIVRFGYRLWAAEMRLATEGATEGTEGVEGVEGADGQGRQVAAHD